MIQKSSTTFGSWLKTQTATMTEEELASFCGVSLLTVRRWLRDKQIPSRKNWLVLVNKFPSPWKTYEGFLLYFDKGCTSPQSVTEWSVEEWAANLLEKVQQEMKEATRILLEQQQEINTLREDVRREREKVQMFFAKMSGLFSK